ncbi:acyltransferase domain-containing protein, partial [Actinoplanes sp. NPDC048791]|uniref:acyltransferase domain-containing protein n=1 Tax=Actinoplanes sp. NPDC048791 TaxID=3154623 RepID=UPI0033C17B57
LADHLDVHPELPAAYVASSLERGRRALTHRTAVVTADPATAAAALRSGDPRSVVSGLAAAPPIAFMFPGQGSQHLTMAESLYDTAPVFRDVLDECARLLRPHLGEDLRTILYPRAGREEHAGELLHRTAFTQPALFAVEYALARTWMAAGVRPDAMIGHSLGEYVAACVSGVFSLEQALAVVAVRGKLMGGTAPGAMLSVPLAAEDLVPYLGHEGVSIAAVNGGQSCVAAGEPEAIAAVRQVLQQRGVTTRLLRTQHAFHTAAMDPILAPFTAHLSTSTLRVPQIPFLSGATGTWITAAQATDPAYWATQLRHPVRFADGLSHLLGDPGHLLLEVGPGYGLSTLARSTTGRDGRPPVAVPSLRDPRSHDTDADQAAFALARATLWVQGHDSAPLQTRPELRTVPLPTYPFARTRHSMALGTAGPEPAVAAAVRGPEPAIGGIEAATAAIWHELLGIDDVEPDADLFALGGDSWLAVQMVNRIQADLGVSLTLGQFFTDPTLRGVLGMLPRTGLTDSAV